MEFPYFKELEVALEWWKSVSSKTELSKKYYNHSAPLMDSEVYYIWLKEHE